MLLTILHFFSAVFCWNYVFTGLAIKFPKFMGRFGFGPTQTTRTIFKWERPLFPFVAFLNLMINVSVNFFDVYFWIKAVVFTFAFFYFDDIDDDIWKKAWDKATGIVKNLGHRLTVVPAKT